MRFAEHGDSYRSRRSLPVANRDRDSTSNRGQPLGDAAFFQGNNHHMA